MALFRLFAVLLVLVAIGFLYGAANEECEEVYNTSLPTKICKKYGTPKEVLEKVKEELKQNPWLKTFKHDQSGHNFDKNNFEITGDADSCMAISKIVELDAITVNNSLYHVVQSNEFKQRIKLTRCMNLNNGCLDLEYGNNDITVERICKEKTSSVPLYVYNTEKKKIIQKPFELPVCCACMYKDRSNNYE